jgi:two-component system, cell cycle response regulator DivK
VTGTVDADLAFGRARRAASRPAEHATARARNGSARSATASTTQEPEVGSPTPRVLVVDDDPSILDVLGEFVADELGADVERASNGAVALAAVLARRPDLVLLDLRMPVLDGFEACRRLKADPATRAIPVVAVSADGNRAAALAVGCDDFVAKPFDLIAIAGVVRRWLPGA